MLTSNCVWTLFQSSEKTTHREVQIFLANKIDKFDEFFKEQVS